MILAWWQITLIIVAFVVGGILALLAAIGLAIFLAKWLVYACLTKEQRREVRRAVKNYRFPDKPNRIRNGSGMSGTA